MNNHGLKKGYKQTDVGIIPENWEVKQFCEIGKLSKGKGLLKEDIKRNGSIPAIPYTALYTDYSEIVDYKLIKWFINNESQSVIVNEPCLLLASSSNMEANTGKASALIGNTSVAIGREVIIFKTSSDCRFISYLLSTESYRKKTLMLARGTTIKHLYPATFQDYQIALPPLPEQQAIAEVLSDFDALITSLHELIIKKRTIKQGTMQLLLTGKKRLPGFSGEWETKKLGEIAEFNNGKAHENSISENGKYIVINSKFISSDGEVKKYSNNCFCSVTIDEIVMVMSDVPNGKAIAKCFFIDENEKYTLNQRICSIKALNANSKFLFYKINRNPYYLTFDDGVKQTNLKKSDVLNCPLKVPPTIEEQKAIAQILSEMDAEIEALEAKRDKYKAVKQGIMQELLTGKTRLI